MAKLTWKALAAPEPVRLSDPAVRGDGFTLTYRYRKDARWAELRWKLGAGRWTSHKLGRVQSEWQAGTRQRNPELFAPGWADVVHFPEDGVAYEAFLDAKFPDRNKPVPVEAALEPIRERARAMVAKLSAGLDPRVEATQAAQDTLGAVAELFLRHSVKRPKTMYDRTYHLRTNWRPFHNRPLASLTRREIATHVLALKDAHGVFAANRARTTLGTMFNWAIGQGYVEANPVDKAGRAGDEPSRKHVVSLPELRAVWTRAGDGDYGAIVRLLMLTGQRRGEVGGMLWSELSPDLTMWNLPGERTKNKQAHVVPLCRRAVALLRRVPRHEGRDRVFGAVTWGRDKAALDKRCGVVGWRLHDLRRSWDTHVNELGIAPPHVADAVLNHAKPGMRRIYNRAEYMPERRRAMRRWAACLLRPMAPAQRLTSAGKSE